MHNNRLPLQFFQLVLLADMLNALPTHHQSAATVDKQINVGLLSQFQLACGVYNSMWRHRALTFNNGNCHTFKLRVNNVMNESMPADCVYYCLKGTQRFCRQYFGLNINTSDNSV